MMHDDYLNRVIRRGNDLCRLEHAAALSFPKRTSTIRWTVAAAFALLLTLLPSVCSAQAFFQII